MMDCQKGVGSVSLVFLVFLGGEGTNVLWNFGICLVGMWICLLVFGFVICGVMVLNLRGILVFDWLVC